MLGGITAEPAIFGGKPIVRGLRISVELEPEDICVCLTHAPAMIERVKVREVVRLLERDGWYLVAVRGSHRQFKRPEKPGDGRG